MFNFFGLQYIFSVTTFNTVILPLNNTMIYNIET